MGGSMFGKLAEERGSVSIIVAISIAVLMAFSAIVIDVGRVALEKQELQNALDAACLAGAQELPDSTSTAMQMAITYFEQNGFPEEAIQQIEFLNLNKKIRITAGQPVEYTFAKIFQNGNNTTVKVSASGGKIEGSAYIFMPDFSDVINLATSIDQSSLINIFGATYTEKNNEYAMSEGQLNSLLTLYPTALINGNLAINGSGINSTGSIITTGDMVFNGSNVNMDASDSVCFYSMNGNITFNGGNGNVNGILYAPSGTVRLNGSGGIFYGSIVGDLVTCDGGINLTYNAQVAGSVPLTITRLVE